MRKGLFLALALAAVAIAVPVSLAAAGDRPVAHFPQKAALGFYRNQVVEYLDFGPIKLRPGNKVADIWGVTNGANGQHNVIDTVPGKKGYSPLWDVNLVTWKAGVEPRLLRSAAAIRAAVRAGDATVKKAGVVVNCPLI